MPLSVELFDGDPQEWNGFVSRHPAATFAHQHEWLQVVRRAYGGRPYPLAARREGKIVGLLPLMLRWVLGPGRILTAAPFADEGGVCTDLAEDAAALLDEAQRLGRDVGAAHVELKELSPPGGDGVPCDDSRVTLRMPLPAAAEQLWDGLSKNMRKKVRRARRDGLTTEDGGAEGIGPFYGVYSRNMRDLGAPMHARGFFETLFEAFPRSAVTTLIRSGEGEVVGAAVSLCFGESLTALCGHSLRSHQKLFPNNLLYWRLFEIAIERGCSVADFGRSPRGSGTYEFKKLWGMEERQLYYQYLPVMREPRLGERRAGAAYRLFSTVWRRVPVGIARRLGPPIFARIQL